MASLRVPQPPKRAPPLLSVATLLTMPGAYHDARIGLIGAVPSFGLGSRMSNLLSNRAENGPAVLQPPHPFIVLCVQANVSL